MQALDRLKSCQRFDFFEEREISQCENYFLSSFMQNNVQT